VAAAGNNIHLLRPRSDPDWSWAAVLPGSAIIGFWYWCTDQYIVQRVLAGKNQREARRGAILAAFLKLTPVFIFLVPGMIAFALTSVPGTGFSTSGDAAYTSLVAQILPHGLRGMVACSMIVALMASLASKFNAAATLVTMDFFRERYPNATGRTEVLVGRIATAAIVVMGVCWVLVIKSLHSDLYVYLQSVQGYLSPAIAVLFLLGVFWKRATPAAALWAFVIGVAGGFARTDGALVIHWLYYTQILFITTAALMIVLSFVTRPAEPAAIRFTWCGATAREKAATRASWTALDVALSLAVLGAVVVFYILFW
jgi:SSS family solute:Na+ symporter